MVTESRLTEDAEYAECLFSMSKYADECSRTHFVIKILPVWVYRFAARERSWHGCTVTQESNTRLRLPSW